VTGKLLSGLAASAILVGAYLMALNLASSTRLSAEERAEAADDGGPQIVLREVEMIEAGPGGRFYRLISDDATYSFRWGQVFASGVTLSLKQQEGDVVVTASTASWNMSEGRIELAEGASAGNGLGWTASAPIASIDLKSEVISAEEARLAGPGITVMGSNLRWRWHDGTMSLDSPRSRILPDRVSPPDKAGVRP
jgi:hypothetical protein